jgi:site-specific DNA recombinase
MIAAIYARKSTEQNDVGNEAKSVTRQIEHARAYAATKGWTVAEAHVYVDDGISGAEFAKRPGLVRLINALSPRPPFQMLVMSEESRLGREQIETAYLLKQLITAGVRVSYYLEDRERTLDSPTEKLLLSVATFADEMERVKARARTRDAMLRKARAGHVAAGRKYGYENVAVTGPDGNRSHVDRQINDAEAMVVRRIFEIAGAGYGFRRIAHALNAEAALAPRATHGRKSGWSASTVRDALQSEIYRGVLIWGQTQKRDGWGQRVTRRRARQRPPADWIRVERPDLRIVPEPLWEAVQARLRESRAIYLRSSDGHLHGRPVSGIAAKYLLTGMAVCGQCGGALTIRTRAHGTSRLALYQCLTHVTKGPRICANRSAIRQREAESAVLETVQHQLLQPDDILPILEAAVRELQGSDAETKRQHLEADLARLATELGRLTEGIAAGGGVSLVDAVKAREAQQETLRGELAALDQLTQVGRLDRTLCLLGLARPPVARLGGGRLHRPTRDRHPVAAVRLQDLLDLEEPPARARPSGRRPGDPSAHPTDVQGQPPVGRAADSRGASETRRRDLAGCGLQVPCAPSEAAIADLADLSRQPPGKPCRRGLLRRAHRAVQGLVRFRGPGARAAARPSYQRHRHPHGPVDGAATRGGVPLGDRPAIRAARSRCGLRGRVLEASPDHGDP